MKIAKSEYVLMIAAVLLLIIIGFAVPRFYTAKSPVSDQTARPAVQPPKIIGQATVTFDFGKKNQRAFTGDIFDNGTVLAALDYAAQAGNLSYKLDEQGKLAAVGDFKNGASGRWHIYLNGTELTKPLSGVEIKSGDEISAKYESR